MKIIYKVTGLPVQGGDYWVIGVENRPGGYHLQRGLFSPRDFRKAWMVDAINPTQSEIDMYAMLYPESSRFLRMSERELEEEIITSWVNYKL